MPPRKLVLSGAFERNFKKFVRKNPRLEEYIFETLQLLEKDAFSVKLKTHKLNGKL